MNYKEVGMSRLWISVTALVGVIVLLAVGFFTWQRFYPVQAQAGWRVEVAYDGLEKAAGLGLDEHGNLLVTTELQHDKGQLLSIDAQGRRSVLVDKLSKPDGLVPYLGGYAFSQETPGRPVSLLHNGAVEQLFMGESVQGLKADGPLLYAIEDRKGDGRLLRFDARDKSLTVLREGLSESESIEFCPDGRKLYTVKAAGVIKRLADDGSDPVYLAGFKSPTFLLCDERGLWVVEDQTHLARLWLVDASGKRQVVLSHLRAPQELLPLGDGHYLLAEGGRDRVLRLSAENRSR